MDNKQRETNRLILFYFICQKAVFAGRWRCGKSSKIPSKNPLQNNPVTAARTTLSHWVDRSMEIPSMWTRKNIQNFVKGNGSETASNNVFKRVRLNGCQPRAQPTIHLSIWAGVVGVKPAPLLISRFSSKCKDALREGTNGCQWVATLAPRKTSIKMSFFNGNIISATVDMWCQTISIHFINTFDRLKVNSTILMLTRSLVQEFW